MFSYKSNLRKKYSQLKERAKKAKLNYNYNSYIRNARKLNNLISKHRNVFKEIPYEKVQIRKGEIEIEKAHLEREKGGTHMDTAKKFKACAEKTRPQGNPTNTDCELKLEARHEYCLSQYYRLRGMSHKEGGNLNIEQAFKDMEQGMKKAKTAARLNDKFEGHLKYTEYWYHMLAMRKQLVEGNPKAAEGSLDETLKRSKDKYYPNYFLSENNLRKERFFIKAYEYLIDKELESAIEELQEWLNNSETIKGSWRYNNIVLRKLVLKALYSLDRGKPSKIVLEKLRKAGQLVKKKFLGSACWSLVETGVKMYFDNETSELSYPLSVKTAQRNFLSEIIDNFALDAIVENYEPGMADTFIDPQLDPLTYLPNYFSKIKTDNLSSITEIKTLVKQLFQILVEYYHYLLDSEKYTNIQKMNSLSSAARAKKPLRLGLNELAKTFLDLCRACDKKLPDLSLLEGGLNSSIAKNGDGLEDLRNQILEKVFHPLSIKYFPHMVRLRRFSKKGGDATRFELERCWNNKPKNIKLLDKSGEVSDKISGKGYYYLDPDWNRKFHTHFEASICIYRADVGEQILNSQTSFEYNYSKWNGDINNLLREMESNQLEFKRQTPKRKDLFNTILAFANSVGGMLVVGVEDGLNEEMSRHKVTGVRHPQKIIDYLSDCNEHVYPEPVDFKFWWDEYNDKIILIIEVESVFPNPPKSGPYTRKDAESVWFRDHASTRKYTGADIISRWEKEKEKHANESS